MIRLTFLSLFAILMLSSCNSDDSVELIEIPFIIEFEIPAALNTIEDHFFEIRNILNPTTQLLEANGIDESSIVRINPKAVQLLVLFDNTELSFIQECSIQLFSDVVGRESEAFWTNSIPFNAGSDIDVPGTLIDASDFLDQDRINVRVQLDTREVNSRFISARMNMTFTVRGN